MAFAANDNQQLTLTDSTYKKRGMDRISTIHASLIKCYYNNEIQLTSFLPSLVHPFLKLILACHLQSCPSLLHFQTIIQQAYSIWNSKICIRI